MMPIVEINGSRETRGVKLTTNGLTEILAGPRSGFITLESLRYACGASGSTLTLQVTDGTTSWNLMNTQTVAANTSAAIEDHVVLKAGWSIQAQAADANRIDIVAVFVLSGQSGTS